MTDFRVKGEGLRWEFIIPTTRHSDCHGVPFELPFVCRLYKTWPSNHIVAAVGSQFALYGVCQDLVGVCLRKLQLAPPGCYCVLSRGALLIRHSQNPEGR